MNAVLKLRERLMGYPFGKQLFNLACVWRAPFFGSVSPSVEKLRPSYCEVLVRKRRRVQNHIGTMHVIALANGLELAMGAMAEASIPGHLRWIPKGMTLSYVAKGKTDIRCIAQLDEDAWQVGDLKVPVVALDMQGQEIITGHILLWVTEKA